MGRLAAAWAGVRGVTRLLPFQANPSQKTLVAQHAPQFAPHLRIISPVAPAPFGSPSSSSRLHRFERFPRDEFTAKGGRQQHIGGQMRQVVVPRFILAPTPGDLPAQDRKGFL